MDYLIVTNTILTFIICLTKANEGYESCRDDEDCMDLNLDKNQECVQAAQDIIDKTNDAFGNDQLRYCGFKKVCCKEKPVPESISETICMEWQYSFEDFCKQIPLIAHGEKVPPHSLPFMALIKFTAPDVLYICSGALISRQWVLTAGHCLDRVADNPNIVTTVYLGAHNTSNSGIPFKGTPIKHPEYGPDPYADLALIKLESEAVITDKVKPACLVKNNSTRTKNYHAAGWGLNGTSNSEYLQKTNLTEKKIESCENNPNPDKQLCLRPQQPIGDVCQGDSGGPIFAPYPGHDNCYIEILGVVSFGQWCEQVGSYTLHVRVDYYKDWIEETVWSKEKKAEYK